MPRVPKPKLVASDFEFEKILPEWQVNRSAQELTRVFEFQDFKDAFEFMTLCAGFAEELEHHPDWSNAGNKVVVQLTTHSAGGLTQLDVDFAKKMDALALQINAHPPHDPLR